MKNNQIKTNEVVEFQVTIPEFLFNNQTSPTANVTVTFQSGNTYINVQYDTELSNLPVDSVEGVSVLSWNDLRVYNRYLGTIKALGDLVKLNDEFMDSTLVTEFVRAVTKGIKESIPNKTMNLIAMFGSLELDTVFNNGTEFGFLSSVAGEYKQESTVTFSNGYTIPFNY